GFCCVAARLRAQLWTTLWMLLLSGVHVSVCTAPASGVRYRDPRHRWVMRHGGEGSAEVSDHQAELGFVWEQVVEELSAGTLPPPGPAPGGTGTGMSGLTSFAPGVGAGAAKPSHDGGGTTTSTAEDRPAATSGTSAASTTSGTEPRADESAGDSEDEVDEERE